MAILVQRGISPVPSLTQLEATAIQTDLAGRLVKIIAAYISPSRPLIGADLEACFGGGLPVLLAGDLNAKHADWNSRLSTTRGKLLRDYADSYSSVNFGPDSPTTNPYIPSATPDVLDIVITRDFKTPIDLTSSSALSSDHLPVFVDTRCRSPFHCPSDRPHVRRTNWANFQAQLESKIPLNLELLNSMEIEAFFGNFSGAILEALVASSPKRRPHVEPKPRPRLVFRMKYA